MWPKLYRPPHLVSPSPSPSALGDKRARKLQFSIKYYQKKSEKSEKSEKKIQSLHCDELMTKKYK